MSYPHSAAFDKKIRSIIRSTNGETQFINDGLRSNTQAHEDFIKDFNTCKCTNLVHDTFTQKDLKQYPCSDCGAPSQERCHGIGEERAVLLRRALQRVWPDTSKVITLRTILIAFLEEHKYTQFTLKCKECHRKEPKQQKHNVKKCRICNQSGHDRLQCHIYVYVRDIVEATLNNCSFQLTN